MDGPTFQTIFKEHLKKLSAAFIKLSDEDWKGIAGDMGRFLRRCQAVYKIPEAVLLKELDAVKKNIDEGIEADYVPYLDPIE